MRGHSSQIYVQSMCICMPVRLAVMLMSAATFLTGLWYLFGSTSFTNVFRHFTGGYMLSSRVVIGAFEVTGVWAGLAGTLGCWYSKVDYIWGFLIWQVLRLIGWIFMYFVDLPLLNKCELWVNDVELMTRTYGWNPVMYEVAMQGGCEGERRNFFVLSGLTVLSFMYVVWGTARYLRLMTDEPKHLLRVNKDLASGAFHATSTGERSHLTGMWKKFDTLPMSMPPPGAMPPPGMLPPPGSMPPQPGFGTMPPGPGIAI